MNLRKKGEALYFLITKKEAITSLQKLEKNFRPVRSVSFGEIHENYRIKKFSIKKKTINLPIAYPAIFRFIPVINRNWKCFNDAIQGNTGAK